MKKCVKCQNDLPDSAVHCVFCGAKQPASAPSAGPNKTMMGAPGMVQELLAASGAPKPVQDPGSSPVPQPMSDPASAPINPPPGTASPAAKTMFAAGAQPGGPPPAAPSGGPPAGGPAGGPPPGAAVGPTIAPQGIGPTMAPGGMAPPPGQPSPGQPAPMPGQPSPVPGQPSPPPGNRAPGPPPGMAPPPGGMDPTNPPPSGPTMPPPGAAAPGMPGGPMGGSMAGPVGKGKITDDRPETEQVKPLPPPKPPYLASESAKRMSNPVEPWSESIKTLMLVFGVLLVACFVAPWAVTGGGTVFSWTALSSGTAYQKVVVLMIAGTGVLSVLLGALPLAVSARGFACAVLGLGAFLYVVVGQAFVWQFLVGAIGMALLVSGLLIRSQYTRATLGRIFVTLGVILVLLMVFVPFSFADLFKAIGSAPGAAKLAAIGHVVPFIIAILALTAWLPGPGKALSGLFAWILILWPLIQGVLDLLSSGDIGPALKGGLSTYIYIPLATMAWTAMAGYGIATIFGKKLEQP